MSTDNNAKTIRPCSQCDGCGKVANSDDKEPWTFWGELKPPENIAVLMGLVKPITCDKCGGTGEIQ